MALKPQDLVVCLQLALPDYPEEWTYPELAGRLKLSISESNAATHRASAARLLTSGSGRSEKPRPVRASLLRFLEGGVPFAFYAHPGEMVRGVPTAHWAPPLSEQLVAMPQSLLVWPSAKGKARGQSLRPLYKTVPEAAAESESLYAALALVDALRVGRQRERKLAMSELSKLLESK
ncbi:hypothetical protein Poly30_10640 [Planctomycetes bacterium Poly30]|uniref:Uncharacterized protein n=2 Tax=Saltatorellus ferox TaxID=2528018 RepID=A0A518EN94_9BACT|nr:hypothetical protein Poly30_10640 [Planctomycetes bacterium Poly30]